MLPGLWLPLHLSLSAAAAAIPGVADRCPPRDAWPDPDWPEAPASERAALAAPLAALEQAAFPPGGRAPDRRGVRTDAVLILKGGRVLYERYADGFGPGIRHAAWSMAKSLTSALAGAAVARGALGVEDSICRHRPAPERHCGITVRHLLESASGLGWAETYEGSAAHRSSVLAMLYGEGSRDMAAFVLSHAPRAPPGREWSYSSGDSVLLASVLASALAPRLGRDWPHAALLDPIGMTGAVFERDAAGTPVGSSWLHATARDLARLGYLYLNDGCWRGERLLPPGWVAATTTVSAPSRAGSPHRLPGDVQGWGWWLNRPVPEVGQGVPWPGVPEDAYSARGHWGQLIVVVPSLDLVIVRLGDDREAGAFDEGRFAALAVAAGAGP